MPRVSAVLVDFDATACLHDVAEHLLQEFAEPGWTAYDDAVERGEIGLRDAIVAQAAMLRAPTEAMLRYALAHCPMDPSFAPFVAWAMSEGVPVTLVSDGFGFYIEPLLAAAGIVGVRVITNTWGEGAMTFANGHGECIGCGTCKMRAVLEARTSGPVGFVGEGVSDRYGALYADLVFAKDVLVDLCVADGVPFERWSDFADVRRGLEGAVPAPGPVAPVRCPGWRTPPSSRSPEVSPTG